MKKLLPLIACLLFLFGCAGTSSVTTTPAQTDQPSQSPTPEPTPAAVVEGETSDVFIICDGQLCGLADSTGELVSQCVYSSINIVSKNRLALHLPPDEASENYSITPCALSAMDGRVLTDFKYYSIWEIGGTNGMGIGDVCSDGSTELLDLSTGSVLLSIPSNISFIGVSPETDSFMVMDLDSSTVSMCSLSEAKLGKLTVIQGDDGKDYTLSGVESVDNYCQKNGSALLYTGDRSVLFLGDSSPEFDYVDGFESDSDILCFSKDERWGFMDMYGNQIIENRFESASGFSCGMAAVCENGKFGYIGTDGAYLLEPIYDYAVPFFAGYAQVVLEDNRCIIDTQGNVVVSGINSSMTSESFEGIWYIAATKDDGFVVIRPDGIFTVDDISAPYSYVTINNERFFAIEINSADEGSFYSVLYDTQTGKTLYTDGAYSYFSEISSPLNSVAKNECFVGCRADTSTYDLFAPDGSILLTGLSDVYAGGKTAFSVLTQDSFGIIDHSGNWVLRMDTQQQ